MEDVADVARRSPYRPWAELLRRTFGFDVLACPRCHGRMRLLAMVTKRRVAVELREGGSYRSAPSVTRVTLDAAEPRAATAARRDVRLGLAHRRYTKTRMPSRRANAPCMYRAPSQSGT